MIAWIWSIRNILTGVIGLAALGHLIWKNKK